MEKYVQKNWHLPGIPSAEEVVQNGVDIGTMDARLLEKVKELTLYSIQLEKTTKQQQLELAELKRLVRQLTDKK